MSVKYITQETSYCYDADQENKLKHLAIQQQQKISSADNKQNELESETKAAAEPKKNKPKKSMFSKFSTLRGTTGESKKPVSKNQNAYYEVHASQFNLRSKTYLKDKVKQPSEDSGFELVSLFLLETGKLKIHHVSQHLSSLKVFLNDHPDEQFFIAVRVLPTTPKVSVITVSKRKKADATADQEGTGDERTPFDILFDEYLEKGDAFRNQRLKYIAKLENAPWAVLTTVKTLGGERPVLLGNGYIEQQHYTGDNYYEVNVDIGSSFVARQITNSVLKYANLFKINECFVIEAQTVQELPERALMSYSLENIDMKQCCYQLTEEDYETYKEKPYPKQS